MIRPNFESEPIPELGNRTWEELEVVTHNDGHLLFKDQIRKRNSKGKFEALDVRVRIVRTLQIAEARAEAREWFTRLKLDPDRDKDTFDALEQICILSHSIREFKAPYAQLATTEDLARDYDEASLQDVSARIQALRLLMDPRKDSLSRDEIWTTIQQVAERGHLLPLADIVGHEQPSCIVFMASQAMRSPMGLAWLQSQGISTPEQSPEKSSQGSSTDRTG